ncbi:hypothetical protein V6N13_093343 [Hibiscus sabdariffa]
MLHTPSYDAETWRCLSFGGIKVNMDGAFDPTRCSTIVGVVARDYQGVVVGKMAQTMPGYLEACLSEIHALNVEH